jgi:hypothetical protein
VVFSDIAVVRGIIIDTAVDDPNLHPAQCAQ